METDFVQGFVVPVLEVGAVAALVLGPIFFWQHRKRAARARLMREGIAEIDTKVVVDERTGTATCVARGFKVVFRFATRGSGSSSEPWTEADVEVATAPLTLHLVPETRRMKRNVERGLAVDVQLGEPDFDALFLVEAAPVSLVRSVLSRDVQERLIALKADELSTGPFGLRLAKQGWNEDPDAIREFVDLAAMVAERITTAVAAAVEAAAPQVDPYRGEAGASQDRRRWEAGKQRLAAQHAAEVEHVERVRVERVKRQRLLIFGLMGLMVLITSAFLLFRK